MIYLDNAATSWPKPEEVYSRSDQLLRRAANPGRGGHRFSRQSAEAVLVAREAVASFFSVPDARQVIFTSGATQALNAVILGLQGVKRIVSTGAEHNAVWRPLEFLSQQRGVMVEYVETGDSLEALEAALMHPAELVVVTHASNVTGKIYPLQEIVARAHAAGALVLADVSQSAGVLPLNLVEIDLDFAAFPGHKGLLGPPGIGGLYIKPGLELSPLVLGGTGSNSHDAELPAALPDRYESGTVNLPGIAGMAAGVGYLQKYGLGKVLAHECMLRLRAAEALGQLGAEVYLMEGETVGVLSFNLPGVDSGDVAGILDEVYDIAVRGGLHCSPRSHDVLGTSDQGTVRISPGIFNKPEEIDQLVAAVSEIVDQGRRY